MSGRGLVVHCWLVSGGVSVAGEGVVGPAAMRTFEKALPTLPRHTPSRPHLWPSLGQSAPLQ